MSIIDTLLGKRPTAEKTSAEIRAAIARLDHIVDRNNVRSDAARAEGLAIADEIAAALFESDDAKREKLVASLEGKAKSLAVERAELHDANLHLDAQKRGLLSDLETALIREDEKAKAELHQQIIASAKAALKALDSDIDNVAKAAEMIRAQLANPALPAEIRAMLLAAIEIEVDAAKLRAVKFRPSAEVITIDSARERARAILAAQAEGRDLLAEEAAEDAAARRESAHRLSAREPVNLRELENNLVRQDAPAGGARYAYLAEAGL